MARENLWQLDIPNHILVWMRLFEPNEMAITYTRYRLPSPEFLHHRTWVRGHPGAYLARCICCAGLHCKNVANNTVKPYPCCCSTCNHTCPQSAWLLGSRFHCTCPFGVGLQATSYPAWEWRIGIRTDLPTPTNLPDVIKSKTLEHLHVLLHKGPLGIKVVHAWEPWWTFDYHVQSMEITLPCEAIAHLRTWHKRGNTCWKPQTKKSADIATTAKGTPKSSSGACSNLSTTFAWHRTSAVAVLHVELVIKVSS